MKLLLFFQSLPRSSSLEQVWNVALQVPYFSSSKTLKQVEVVAVVEEGQRRRWGADGVVQDC